MRRDLRRIVQPSFCARMRLIVVGLGLSLCTLIAFSQTSGTPEKEDNLYSQALFASLSQMEKSWGYIDQSDHDRIRMDYRHMPVRKNPEITDDLPSQAEDYQVEYLDDQALIKKYRTLRKKFPVIEIHPMRSDGRQLRITISVSWFELSKRGNPIFAFSDWSNVEFRHDCEKQSYSISAVKLGGI